MKQYTLVTPAATVALTLAEVKDHLKISGSDYDTQLTNLIAVVTEYAEKATGRDLINKIYKGYLDYFPSVSCWSELSCNCSCLGCAGSIEVRKSKLQSITSIQYYLDGALTTFSSTDYYFTDSADYSRIYLVNGKSWPSSVDNRKQAIVITFIAGYGAAESNIPYLLRQAMLSQITTLFENAGDCAADTKQFQLLYTPFIIASNFLRVI